MSAADVGTGALPRTPEYFYKEEATFPMGNVAFSCWMFALARACGPG